MGLGIGIAFGKKMDNGWNSFRVINQNESQVEVSFKRPWDPSDDSGPRLKRRQEEWLCRFIMLRGSSGFYAYAIYERLQGWHGTSLWQTRLVFKLREDLFDYMAISDTRQRVMPTAEDRARGKPLAYPEAVLLTNPSNPDLKGEVDDKYQYASDSKDNKVHGWISQKSGVGFWIITPSDEFRISGPLKQELTSHAGPVSLSVFTSSHYVGKPEEEIFKDGEAWKKVFGPIFIYLNSVSNKKEALSLWNDAKQQMLKEVDSWPYSFPLSQDFPKSHQRGSVEGRLLVLDKYINQAPTPASLAYVGLSLPGEAGSWQTETKGYQFWTQADKEGNFSIRAVRAGTYNLFAWVPGIMGDYKYDAIITIKPGNKIKLGNIVFEPPRHGPTLWEIGIPDRTAAEFFVPDVDPKFINKLYVKQDKFRQYGLWDRYADIYPNQDLVYTVGKSDYRKDWFFAHVNRHVTDDTFLGTTWQIVFDLPVVDMAATYKFRLVLAGASLAQLQVRLNDPNATRPLLSTELIGRENLIARHGIHGLLRSYTADIPGFLFVEGCNTIYLTQTRASNSFQGVMYDYIRLEGPPQ
ncbi:Rhamnogalacturonate lyase [Vitis vinifera]|uniref:rhamnogalacturonan endolyase n=1 Tax=Vitis vinifera TaxID=29760 RepID=A0A438FBE6_VITVI|nr:Rhamnogalacturonate lyase [Vitis vinifera]